MKFVRETQKRKIEIKDDFLYVDGKEICRIEQYGTDGDEVFIRIKVHGGSFEGMHSFK